MYVPFIIYITLVNICKQYVIQSMRPYCTFLWHSSSFLKGKQFSLSVCLFVCLSKFPLSVFLFLSLSPSVCLSFNTGGDTGDRHCVELLKYQELFSHDTARSRIFTFKLDSPQGKSCVSANLLYPLILFHSVLPPDYQ